MLEDQLQALSKAWVVTVVAMSLLLAAAGIKSVWNPHTYKRALRETLLNNQL